ncbi:hypothetical protein HNQ88_001189 [Aureibacter tunicatorum]|uniref:Uncharacterized protein n=1 Tax=Aureibacter tunicatorum TaxID=866807 RepID=A0AAE4BRT0_9BACT|nr:hypothetical protein [Aureibacter tunicatorum]BDD03246.1 hypothetical protein AUTU_07290 [Aureibacter tunicatorum]
MKTNFFIKAGFLLTLSLIIFNLVITHYLEWDFPAILIPLYLISTGLTVLGTKQFNS